MAVKTGVVRSAFSIVRLETAADRLRDEFPDGPELQLTCDDGTELVVGFGALPTLKPLEQKRGRWEKIQSDPLAARFRADGPAPHHEVTLSHLTLAPRDRVEVEGQVAENAEGFAALGTDHQGTHLLATALTKLDGETSKRVPLVPGPLDAPLYVLIPLAAFVLARIYLASTHGAAMPELITDVLSMLLVALAFVLRRTKGRRFLALKLDSKGTNDTHEPKPYWGFLNGSYTPDLQAFLICGPGVFLGFTLICEKVGTKDWGPQGAWPIAVWYFGVAIGLLVSERSSREAARRLLSAPPLTADGQWGSVVGTIHAAKPLKALGIDSVAVYTNLQKFEKTSSSTGHVYSDIREIDNAEVGTVEFTLKGEGATWQVDPNNSVWGSAGRITPPSSIPTRDGYSVTFAEVIPASGRALVVGRANKGAFKTADRDGLYIFPAPADGDPRAELRSYLRWSAFVCVLPILAIAVTYWAELAALGSLLPR